MREGTNPLRKATVDGYKPIVVSAITHLPDMTGYHEQRLNVIKASLESMRANAGTDCHILIWDNGSCDKLTYWLKRSYQPDFLMQAPNVGKSIARASIVKMLPPSTVVGVADDDMFYYPDWLKAQVEVLQNYPNTGAVSGWPVRTQFRFYNSATIAWGKRYAKYEVGKFISPQEDEDFCTSIGRDYKDFQIPYTVNDFDIKLTFRGIETYATGHHAQFIGIAGILAPFVRYDREAMADERPFEKAINDAGLLRLTTYKRYTRHIGNILDPELEVLWQELR